MSVALVAVVKNLKNAVYIKFTELRGLGLNIGPTQNAGGPEDRKYRHLSSHFSKIPSIVKVRKIISAGN